MDYNLQIILVALVAHREFEGSSEQSTGAYATDLFNRFDTHIQKAASDAGIPLDADQRTVVASIAAMVPGTTNEDHAQEAVATFIQLFAN